MFEMSTVGFSSMNSAISSQIVGTAEKVTPSSSIRRAIDSGSVDRGKTCLAPTSVAP